MSAAMDLDPIAVAETLIERSHVCGPGQDALRVCLMQGAQMILRMHREAKQRDNVAALAVDRSEVANGNLPDIPAFLQKQGD